MLSEISIIAAIVSTVELMGLLTAVHAVMNIRTSQGAIAWSISLVTFPWVALPLYAVFGRSKFKGYVSLRNLQNGKMSHIIAQCRKEAIDNALITTNAPLSDIALMRLAQLPITRFNDCRLLVNGEATFRAIFDAIEKAESYILVQFYIINNDDIGRELKARLIAKAKEKVRIYFLYDEIGCYQLPWSYLRELQKHGISTSAFNTTRGRANKFQLNFRNHRKIVVVDGNVAFIGGHNVGDEYLSRHPRFGAWRDTHARVEGPAASAVQLCFLQDWYWATADLPDLDWRMPKSEKGGTQTLVIASGPADAVETCGLMFTQAINSARERIWIASPYFVPDRQILGALKLAVMRGVDVRILIPDKPDHRMVYFAGFLYYENILPLGLHLFRYTAGFMHQKVFLVDNQCAAVGTANLDNRSFRLNFELTLLVYDSRFIKEVEQMLLDDFACSRKAAMADFTEQSFPFRLAVRCASLFAPIL